ncbi:MAG: SDR family oxidoreductase [Stellaceae bacterium]
MAPLDGKICIITGATSGIGFATAVKLAEMGARLALVGSDRERGEAAVVRLQSERPASDVVFFRADLARPPDVRQLARELSALPRVDVLVNNAGAIFRHRHETPEGLERTFALNHLAPYLLTRLLVPKLLASAAARVITVSSRAHVGARLDFDDLQMERRFNGWTAYRRSKLCNILFTRELARRFAGSGVTANALHPGFVASRFADNLDGFFHAVWTVGKRLFAISSARGAETSVYLAAAPEVEGVSCLYFHRCRPVRPTAVAQDDGVAFRLWQASARLVGLPEDGV